MPSTSPLVITFGCKSSGTSPYGYNPPIISTSLLAQFYEVSEEGIAINGKTNYVSAKGEGVIS